MFSVNFYGVDNDYHCEGKSEWGQKRQGLKNQRPPFGPILTHSVSGFSVFVRVRVRFSYFWDTESEFSDSV
jgi:hypothetical protein